MFHEGMSRFEVYGGQSFEDWFFRRSKGVHLDTNKKPLASAKQEVGGMFNDSETVARAGIEPAT